VRVAVQRDALSDHRWIRSETASPKAVGQDRDQVAPRLVLLIEEIAADRGPHVEQAEQVRSDDGAVETLWLAFSEAHGDAVRDTERLERPALRAPFHEVAWAHREKGIQAPKRD